MPENPTVIGRVGTPLIQPTSGEATGQFGIDFRTDITLIDQRTRFLSDAGLISVEAWSTPSLLNSWVNPTGYTTKYLKRYDGVVHLRSALQGGVSGTTPFTLPAGYRPQQTIIIPLAGYTTDFAAPGSGLCSVQITTAGVITLFIAGTSVCVSLDIQFPTF